MATFHCHVRVKQGTDVGIAVVDEAGKDTRLWVVEAENEADALHHFASDFSTDGLSAPQHLQSIGPVSLIANGT